MGLLINADRFNISVVVLQEIICIIKKGIKQQPVEETIRQVRDGRMDALVQLDDTYRPMFIVWAKRRFSTGGNDLEDAWQEALVHFYEQVVSGKLTTLTCSVHTYLFAVGGNYLRNLNRKMRRILWQDEADQALQGKLEMGHPVPEYNWEDEQEILAGAMAMLSEKCRNLLVARHFDGYAVPEIKASFQFASENAVSVHLSNCLANLKKIIQQQSSRDGR